MAFIRFTDLPAFRNPWAEFERIRQGLNELSRGYLNQELKSGQANVFPPLNIYEQADRLIINAELPGVTAADLELSIEGETLTIQGKREVRQNETGLSYHRREIQDGSFSRALTLPMKVDVDNIGATMQSGILSITLMKASPLQPRQIKVQVA